jgi:putative ABC transport system ATP-binding protein
VVKSTLLHVLLGLEPPTQGTVSFFGQDLYSQLDEDGRTELRKKNVGMVYQQPNWIKALTVLENVMFALRINGETDEAARKKSQEALQMVGMLDWQDYTPTELSSGQQQKVSLARAVITNPKVIIADEPTGNLDFKSGEELMQQLKKTQ